MSSYIGMIESSIASGNLKDAIKISRETIIYMPRSGYAYILMAKVMAKNPQGGPESIRAYQKALKLSSYNSVALQGLAELYIEGQKVSRAV
jgi:cytochrome c-type biogenesis protein CcmH/NrfG